MYRKTETLFCSIILREYLGKPLYSKENIRRREGVYYQSPLAPDYSILHTLPPHFQYLYSSNFHH